MRRTTAKSDACPSFCLSMQKNSNPTKRTSVKFCKEEYLTKCRHISILVQSGQKSQSVYTDIYIRIYLAVSHWCYFAVCDMKYVPKIRRNENQVIDCKSVPKLRRNVSRAKKQKKVSISFKSRFHDTDKSCSVCCEKCGRVTFKMFILQYVS
jgi:hypothetical protein